MNYATYSQTHKTFPTQYTSPNKHPSKDMHLFVTSPLTTHLNAHAPSKNTLGVTQMASYLKKKRPPEPQHSIPNH